MTINDLIEELEEIREKYGNVPVLTKQFGFGGYGIYAASKVHTQSLDSYQFASGGENGQIDDEDVWDFFPFWDGEKDSIEDLGKVNCVCIDSGTLIYAS